MTSRIVRPEALDFSHMKPGRSSSFSSDVMSNSARSAATAAGTVPHANPPPAYIAQTEGSDLISAELDRKVVVSSPALTLLNEFLDHVLYSIICQSHSVSLGALKSAVPAVLKPRLGKAALRVAEEELKEYMEDGEAEELSSSRSPVQPKANFDAELVWKLARLRCMVYARMGDLEEEDEEEWLEKEHLLEQAVNSPASARQSMAVTPGSAIFLTSVIEYLGEQALYYSAQYAQRRHDSARAAEHATDPEAALHARHDEILLEAKDMNHVGRDSPLSRLWRSWRRNTRSAPDASSRPMSPESTLSPGADSLHNRGSGNVNHFQPIFEEIRSPGANQQPLTPTRIPLPDSDDEDDLDEDAKAKNLRPSSMPVMPGSFIEGLDSPTQERSGLSRNRPEMVRLRSNSVPNPRTIFEVPRSADRDSFALPIQGQAEEDDGKANETEAVQQESEESVSHLAPVVDSEAIPDTVAKPEAAAAKIQTLQQSASLRRSPKAAQSSEQLNATVGVLAGALGAVGVHHVGKSMVHAGTASAQDSQNRSTPSDEETTMSASIRGPRDLHHSYVPVGRTSPEDAETKTKVHSLQKPKSDRTPQRSPVEAHFAELATKQYQEHKRYSAQSHEMETPSIYTHKQHAPRFPQDMRPSSAVSSRYSAVLDIEGDANDHSQGHISPPGKPFVQSQQREQRRDDGAVESRAVAAEQRPTSAGISPTKASMQYPVQPPVDEYVEQARMRSHSKSSSSSSRLLGFTRDPEGRPQTIHQQRAAGGMSDDVRKAHNSTPSGPAQISPEVASSKTSPARRQHLRLRNGSDNNVHKTRPSEESTKRDFEGLIKSDETLHYTLTPVTATFREDDLNRSSPRHPNQNVEYLRTSPLGPKNATPRVVRSSDSREDDKVVPDTTTKVTNVVISKPPAPKNKNPLGVPRDAKVDRMSGVRDLADYMRSTGPTNEDQLPQALSAGSIRAYSSPQGAVRAQSRASNDNTPNKVANRLKFQARDARPSRSAESSALIDFIREGPPREQGDHRINRHVAPFRTTMDSDDLNALARSLPQTSPDLNGVKSSDSATLSSVTPLLNNTGATGTSSQPASAYNPSVNDAESGMPKKTRRRIKDPYAIEDSDDELLDEVAPLQSNEESLIDFLRNTAPSQNMTAQPILSTPPATSPSIERKPSVDRLKDFVRNARGGPAVDRTAQLQEQSRIRAASPHLTQTGSKLDSYRPTTVTHAPHVDRNRANKVQNRPISRTESRASTVVEKNQSRGYGATADLADYLRNTGPPPSNDTPPQPFILNGKNPAQKKRQEKEGGLKKFFSVRSRK